jgi:hypothetical protein
MAVQRRFLAEQTFSDGDANFLGPAGSESGANNQIVFRLP